MHHISDDYLTPAQVRMGRRLRAQQRLRQQAAGGRPQAARQDRANFRLERMLMAREFLRLAELREEREARREAREVELHQEKMRFYRGNEHQ